MANTDKITAPAPGTSLWPTYALRAWLTTLLVQTQQAELDLKHRIEDREKELERMREQAKRSPQVVQSLHEAIARVDTALKRKLDVEQAPKETSKETSTPARHAGSDTETKTRK
jgi:hypothetical protein